MINIKKFCFNPLQTNCYVVNDGNHAIIIDPCCYFDYEKQELDDYITSNNLKVEHILVTHMHVDHILGLNWCQKKYGVIAEGPNNENHWVELDKQLAKQFGFDISNDISPIIKPFKYTSWADNWIIESIHTPGHSPGHLSYAIYDKYSSASDALFCGDVVFKNGIGRYDFPDSNYEDLQKSIEKVITSLTNQIYPGHGESFSPKL
jgi:glyoxylase-like metal-dependent hydrolase (beta-lactamase superfamily II)